MLKALIGCHFCFGLSSFLQLPVWMLTVARSSPRPSRQIAPGACLEEQNPPNGRSKRKCNWDPKIVETCLSRRLHSFFCGNALCPQEKRHKSKLRTDRHGWQLVGIRLHALSSQSHSIKANAQAAQYGSG